MTVAGYSLTCVAPATRFQLTVAIRSITESLCSGERWLYRADIVIVLWPASSWISLIDAPAIASHEQNVCRFECQTYPATFASSRQGWNQDRVSNLPFDPSRGKTASDAFCRGRFSDSIALRALALRCTVRADPFFVFVSSIVRRSRSTWDHRHEYCSLSRIPV